MSSSPPMRFPLLLSAFCALLAAVVFFTAMVPAAAEERQLGDIERQRERLLEQLAGRNAALRDTELGLRYDPQTLLVEIDRLGMTPDELLARYPEATPEQAEPGPESWR